MQYILTDEEYKNLVPKSQYIEKIKEIEELQQLLMKATGYTCIHEEHDYEGSYCDKCPLAHFNCGKRKEFSK